jgi:copper chaperone CopZ
VAKVTSTLNEVAGKDNWGVDLQTPERVLTVSTDKANEEAIKKAIEKTGYHAEELA